MAATCHRVGPSMTTSVQFQKLLVEDGDDLRSLENEDIYSPRKLFPDSEKNTCLPSAWDFQDRSQISVVSAPLSPEFGHIKATHYPLGEESGLYHSKGQVEQSVPCKIANRKSEYCLILRLIVSGGVSLHFPGFGGGEQIKGDCSVHVGTTPESVVRHKAGTPYESYSLLLTKEKLENIFLESGMPDSVRDLIKEGNLNRLINIRPPAELIYIFKQIVSNPYSGTVSYLYSQAKIFEILTMVVGEIEGSVSRVTRGLSRGYQRVSMARDILMSDLLNPPTIEQLARQVGLSQKRLNQLFQDHYGAGVLKVFTRWRLEKAKDLLEKDLLPVKTVSFMMGYSHPGNFIAAFSKHFGITPGALRKMPLRAEAISQNAQMINF